MMILAYLLAALVALSLPFALARFALLRRHAAQRRYEDDLMDGRWGEGDYFDHF